MIRRGELYWVDLGEAEGSRPGGRRPVVVIQADAYNRSRLATALVAVVTANTALAGMPGNVFLPATMTGLPRDSVVNVTALVTVKRADLAVRLGEVPESLMPQVDQGLRRVLGV